MEKFKKASLLIAVLIVAGLLNFMPSKTGAQEIRYFSNCWGSGDFQKFCTNGTATVYGCEPQVGSYCAGKERVPPVQPTTPQ